MSSPPNDSLRAAERAYEEYAAQAEDGLDFEAFCADRPELAEELRRLHSLVQRVAGALPGSSLSARLAERFGSQADPHVTLAGGDEDEVEPASGFSSEVLGRLDRRKGAFGRYVLKGEIGRGGQGAVVRVWDEDLRRALAMKVLLGKSTPASGERAPGDSTPAVDPRSLGRFLEEAQVTGQLDHPGIVPVHELGLDADGQVYFTMKLVKGRTLQTVLELAAEGREGWTQTRALGVLSRVCEAMAYAHHKGVVHRDLKPANVMVGRFGEVYVMDWGLAKVLGREDTKDVAIVPLGMTEVLDSERRERADSAPDSPLLTMDGDVVGTPAYMPPEQALGKIEAIGAHSDVYALGAMLYHLLAGHMPYVEPGLRLSNYDVWYMEQKGPPTPVLERAPGTPAELVAICERAMAREIDERYPDMQALAADLSAYLEHRVVAAYETGAWAEARKWVQRNKPLAASLAAAVVLLVGGLLTSLAFKARADENAALAERRAEETAEQARIAQSNAEEARRQEDLAQANAERAVEQGRLATQRANDILSLSASKDLEDLVSRAASLWPPHPELVPVYERWLADARRLLDGVPGDPGRGVKGRPSLAEHEAKLAELVAGSVPETDVGRLEQARAHESYPALERARAELLWRRRMLGLEEWPDLEEVEQALAEEEVPAENAELQALARSLVGPEAEDLGQVSRGWVLAARALEGAEDETWPLALMTMAWAEARLRRLEEALASAASAVDEQSALEARGSEAGAGTSEEDAEWDSEASDAAGGAERVESEQLIALKAEAEALEAFVARWEGAAREARGTELTELEARIGALEIEVGERVFEDPEDGWWQRQLAALVSGIRALHDAKTGLAADTLSEGFGWGVGKRYEFARTIGERSVEGPEAQRLWAEATKAIAASPKYGGLVLTPQMGLVPIGSDPDSGLWEFAHLMTGAPAERDADGKLVLTEETGIVLVLIPDGTFVMGAQSTDPDGPNYDPQARSSEGPPHEVELSAYFLSKYEMTQGQWQRVAAVNQSLYQPPNGLAPTLLHPVEHVSWPQCMELMERVGLSLPSEAQWERGTRGGSDTPWWSGAERESLRGKVNLADQTAKKGGANWGDINDWPDLEDGSVVHSEVGRYPPNTFGLHEVAGNLWEWCLDGYDSGFYGRSPKENPVFNPGGSASRVTRGGGFDGVASGTRSAYRDYGTPEYRGSGLGLRPAKGITP